MLFLINKHIRTGSKRIACTPYLLSNPFLTFRKSHSQARSLHNKLRSCQGTICRTGDLSKFAPTNPLLQPWKAPLRIDFPWKNKRVKIPDVRPGTSSKIIRGVCFSWEKKFQIQILRDFFSGFVWFCHFSLICNAWTKAGLAIVSRFQLSAKILFFTGQVAKYTPQVGTARCEALAPTCSNFVSLSFPSFQLYFFPTPPWRKRNKENEGEKK